MDLLYSYVHESFIMFLNVEYEPKLIYFNFLLISKINYSIGVFYIPHFNKYNYL